MTGFRHPDSKALARIGAAVRGRLSCDPSVQRIPDGKVELYAVENFLSMRECKHLMDLIDAVACPSSLVDEAQWTDYRTSYSGDIDVHDAAVRAIDARLAQLTGLPLSYGESAQGQRYRRGQYFQEHYDWFNTAAGYWQREQCSGGQRSWTAMIYLNDVAEGGMTEFTRIRLNVPPRAGYLLLWNNALADGTPNPWSMHAARPVVRGVKYVITKWFRSRAWR